MTKKNLIIGVIVLIILITGVVLWSQKNSKQDAKQEVKQEVTKETQEQKQTQKQENAQEQNNQNQVNNELTLEEIDTSNWKTYRNEELGFEFKYPKGWFCDGTSLEPANKQHLFCSLSEWKEQYYSGVFNDGGVMINIDFEKQNYNNDDEYGIISRTLNGDKYNVQFIVFPFKSREVDIQNIFSELFNSFTFIE